jgi:hypothetical protein
MPVGCAQGFPHRVKELLEDHLRTRGVNCSRASTIYRMKSWLKSTSLPAILLSVLALGTLGMCFLLATHRHTGILKRLVQARPALAGVAGAHQNVAPGPQHTVTLTWKASTTAGVNYNVYRRGLSGSVKLNPAPLAATTYVDRTVQPGQTYSYVAKAVTANGAESIASNEVTVTIPSP